MEQNDNDIADFISTESFIAPPSDVTFEVSNFGCIKHGSFQLNPLTIFCGKNNTGKTWAMYALYSILEGITVEEDLPEIDLLAAELIKSKQTTWNPVNWIERYFADIERAIQKTIHKGLSKTLNISETALSQSNFSYRLNKEWSITHLNKLHLNSILATTANQPALEAEKESGNPEITFKILTKELTDVKKHLVRFIFRQIAGKRYLGYSSPFLLPSERNGLNLIYRELNLTRMQSLHSQSQSLNSGDGDLEKLRNYLLSLSLYAKPIARYIEWLNTLSLSNKPIIDAVTSTQVLTNDLEKISGGTYSVDSYNRINFISDNIESGLHLASSTANSMSGLWFYLNGEGVGTTTGAGTTLMIDEPELNLHPSNQRAFAHLLAKLVNKGIKVIISTHSDYLLNELSTLIMLSQEHPKQGELMQKYGYEESELLQSEQVGAYLFADNTIQSMDVNPTEGIIATTFDEVISDLNETSEDIYYTLRNWKNNKR